MNIHKVLKTFGCIALIVFGAAYVAAQDKVEKPNKPLQEFSMKRAASSTDSSKEIEESLYSLRTALKSDDFPIVALGKKRQSSTPLIGTMPTEFSSKLADEEKSKPLESTNKLNMKTFLVSRRHYSAKSVRSSFEEVSSLKQEEEIVFEELKRWIIQN